VCSFNGTWGTSDHWTKTFTAHSKTCPVTGELIYIGYNMVPASGPPTVTVGVVGTSGGVTHRATLPVVRPSMQHDMVRAAREQAS
jgi:carotenoid cleavage dioxygenase